MPKLYRKDGSRRKRRQKGEPHRWTNKREDGSKVCRGVSWTRLRNERCPHCGKKYRYFRMGMDRTDVYEALKSQQRGGEIKTVTLRTYLGRMHEIKQAAWQAHIESCEQEQAYIRGEISDAEMDGILSEAYRGSASIGSFVTHEKGKKEWLRRQRKALRAARQAASDVPF